MTIQVRVLVFHKEMLGGEWDGCCDTGLRKSSHLLTLAAVVTKWFGVCWLFLGHSCFTLQFLANDDFLLGEENKEIILRFELTRHEEREINVNISIRTF